MDVGYYWRCFTCGCLLRLRPEDAVLAEARAVIGDCTIVFPPAASVRPRLGWLTVPDRASPVLVLDYNGVLTGLRTGSIGAPELHTG